jgi:hypothetical protein
MRYCSAWMVWVIAAEATSPVARLGADRERAAPGDLEEQDFDGERAAEGDRTRAGQDANDPEAGQRQAEGGDPHAGPETELKVERREADQRVEGEEALCPDRPALTITGSAAPNCRVLVVIAK